MSRERLRRLELRLPVTHPIWDIPDRCRATVARQWLDIGARLTAIEKRLDALQKAGCWENNNGGGNGTLLMDPEDFLKELK
jgi:hypothetical protein